MTLLVIALILLNVADVYLTLRILKAGGGEANPIVNYFIQHYGAKEALIGLKVLVAVFVAAVWSHVTWQLLAGLNLVYAVIVWSNYEVMRGRPSIVERLKKLLRT